MYQSMQGNLGLGKAIAYFTSHQIPIAIPLNDTQKYDLIADFNGKLQRVSVKTSKYTETDGASYQVQLKNSGGAGGKSIIRTFDNTSCDYVFVYTANEKIYLIPSEVITSVSSITVGNKYQEYQVAICSFDSFGISPGIAD